MGEVGGSVRVDDAADVTLDRVGGHVDARSVRGALVARAIGASLAAEDVRTLSIRAVGETAIVSRCEGDCSLGAVGLGAMLAHVGGTILAAQIGRDASVRGVGGDCELGAVGGDLTVQLVGGKLTAMAGGDARVTGARESTRCRRGPGAGIDARTLGGRRCGTRGPGGCLARDVPGRGR
jgi:hypothetical protein